MRTQATRNRRQPSLQRGATVVEFALVALIFFTLLIGIMEFARVLFYWNTTSEATRLGARIAVVCDWGAGNIKSKMTSLFPVLTSNNIQVSYAPSGCDPDAATARSNCTSVSVSIANVSVKTLIPVVPITLTLPPFTTTLSRESMTSATGGPICN